MQGYTVTEIDWERVVEVSNAIREQIGIGNLMACGAREWKSIKGKEGLNFRVNAGRKRQFIDVILDPCDTYTVISYKLKNVTDERIELERTSDVYCTELGDIVYHMVNK